MEVALTNNEMKILIIEDQDSYLRHLKSFIRRRNNKENVKADVFSAKTVSDAKKIFAENNFDLAFFDLELNGEIEGFDLLKKYKDQVRYPVILTAFDDQELADKGYHLGSKDYLVKPFSFESINFLFTKFDNYSKMGSFRSYIQDRFYTRDESTLEQLLQMKEARINRSPIHLSGPTGVGKQVTAELIFDLVQKGKGRFIEKNCAGLSKDLLSSELFGHAKGSFTGAIKDKKGIFELVDNGTLFLDEIDKMPLAIQDKLLKVIEQKKFSPVGEDDREIQSDFLLITAASQNLDDLVEQGRFRLDLKERLNGIHINIKGLSERRDDIEYQLDKFIKEHESNRRVGFTKEVKDFLFKQYDWPGNSRELSGFVNTCQTKVSHSLINLKHISHLRDKFLKRKAMSVSKSLIEEIKKTDLTLPNAIKRVEAELIDYFYELNNRSSVNTMKHLGISTRKFYQHTSKKKKGSSNEEGI